MILKRKRRISQDQIAREEEEDKSAFDEEEKVEPME